MLGKKGVLSQVRKMVGLLVTKALVFLACVSVSGLLAGVVRSTVRKKGVLSQVCKMVGLLVTNALIYITLVSVAPGIDGAGIELRPLELHYTLKIGALTYYFAGKNFIHRSLFRILDTVGCICTTFRS